MNKVYSDNQYIAEKYKALNNTHQYLVRQLNYEWTTEEEEENIRDKMTVIEDMMYEMESCVDDEDYERFFSKTKWYWEGK